jgi:antitoxin HicB
MTTRRKHRGPTLDSVLKAEGVYDELKSIVVKEAITWQLEQAMAKKHMSKKRLSELMDTSRTQVDRLLDPKAGNVTLETLQRAAHVVGCELNVGLEAEVHFQEVSQKVVVGSVEALSESENCFAVRIVRDERDGSEMLEAGFWKDSKAAHAPAWGPFSNRVLRVLPLKGLLKDYAKKSSAL